MDGYQKIRVFALLSLAFCAGCSPKISSNVALFSPEDEVEQTSSPEGSMGSTSEEPPNIGREVAETPLQRRRNRDTLYIIQVEQSLSQSFLPRDTSASQDFRAMLNRQTQMNSALDSLRQNLRRSLEPSTGSLPVEQKPAEPNGKNESDLQQMLSEQAETLRAQSQQLQAMQTQLNTLSTSVGNISTSAPQPDVYITNEVPAAAENSATENSLASVNHEFEVSGGGAKAEQDSLLHALQLMQERLDSLQQLLGARDQPTAESEEPSTDQKSQDGAAQSEPQDTTEESSPIVAHAEPEVEAHLTPSQAKSLANTLRLRAEYRRNGEVAENKNALLGTISRFAAVAPQSYKIILEGHTDISGSTEYNHAITAKRIQNLTKALLEAGIAAERIHSQNFANQFAHPSGRPSDRRVEISLIRE